MEPIKRMFTKEAFQDNNFGDGMFKGASEADDDLINKSDLSKGNRKVEQRQIARFQNSIMMEFRKQIKMTKRSLDDFACHTLEGFDDVVGNTLTPSCCLNACEPNKQRIDMKDSDTNETGEQQDPDKIFRQYPSFDPVFMKV